jgi:hypothetical protein
MGVVPDLAGAGLLGGGLKDLRSFDDPECQGLGSMAAAGALHVPRRQSVEVPGLRYALQCMKTVIL